VGDIGFEIELVMAGLAGGEEALVRGVGVVEPSHKAVVDLIAGAGDARADRGGDALAPGAEPFHRGERRIGHAADRTLPPGMRGTDHAGLGIGEQHRRAIGGEDAEREARTIGDQRIGMRPRRLVPGIGDGDGLGAVHLEQADQPPAGQHRPDRAPAILADRPRIVVGAEPDIQPGMHADGDAPAPAEKAVRHASQCGRADYLDRHSTSLMMRSSSIVSPTRKA